MVEIYLITNQINKKQYVGKTHNRYKNRFDQHAKAYSYGERYYLACAIHKYGVENFTIEVLDEVSDTSWEYWERYYIKHMHTHHTEGGYNETYGGDSNPMDDPAVVAKHSAICKSEYFRSLQRELQTGRKHSDKTKELCRQSTLANLEVCMKGFREYNNSRKISVGMVEDNTVIKVFDSLSDAARYACSVGNYKFNVGDTSQIKAYADKFNKNGKRAKFLGYAWTLNV